MAITRDCRRELSLFGKQEVGSQTVVRRPSCVFCALQLWRLYDPVEPSDTQRTIVVSDDKIRVWVCMRQRPIKPVQLRDHVLATNERGTRDCVQSSRLLAERATATKDERFANVEREACSIREANKTSAAVAVRRSLLVVLCNGRG